MTNDVRFRTQLVRYLKPHGEAPAADVATAAERLRHRMGNSPSVLAPAKKVEPTGSYRVRWVPAAAAVALLAAAVVAAIVWPRGDSALYRLVDGAVQTGDTIQTNGGGAQLALVDGSRVEMRAQSELSVERADDGVRIRLSRGGIIVNAAKQRTGHLYVQTRDMTVSVVGTVFLVNVGEDGSRVSVIEGEVRVQQGVTQKTLLPGEQVVTSDRLAPQPVRQEIAWSRNAIDHLALLPEPVVAPGTIVTPLSPRDHARPAAQAPTSARLAFELASVRPSDPAAPGGRSGGSGSALVTTGPCKGGGTVQIDPRRFSIAGATLYYLITAAYGLGSCVGTGDLLSGGPDWIGSDRFDIQAAIPEGSAAYTRDQFNAGEAPAVQGMLQTLLMERFRLTLRREARQLPVYVLEIAPGGPKLTAWKEGDFGLSEKRRYLVTLPYYVEAAKTSMADLASSLRIVTGRTVLDRTGLQGEFTFDLSFAPLNTGLMRATRVVDPSADPRPSLFAALKELGLELKESRASVDVLVIERAERPSEN